MSMEYMEYHDTAAGIFLSSVHRAKENTGIAPRRNVISGALFERICDEMLGSPEWEKVGIPIGKSPFFTEEPKSGRLFGYPIRIVFSQHLFAISLDEHET